MASAPRIPNGIANKPSVELTSIPPVVGINFGNSYASIAVLAKVGVFYLFYARGDDFDQKLRKDKQSASRTRMESVRLLVPFRSKAKRW